MLLTADAVLDCAKVAADKHLAPLVCRALKSLMQRSELARPQILSPKSTCTQAELYHRILCKGLCTILPFMQVKRLPKAVSRPLKKCSLLLLTLGYFGFPTIRHAALESIGPLAARFSESARATFGRDLFPAATVAPSIKALIDRFVAAGGDDAWTAELAQVAGGRNTWRGRLESGGSLLMRFVYVWMKYSGRLMRNAGKETWPCIEGYGTLVRAVMQRMATCEIERYPRGLRNAALALLANDELLGPMIRVVFRKTRYERDE